MSKNSEIRAIFEEKDSKELIELGFALDEQLSDMRNKFDILKFILRERMIKENAKAIFHPSISCTAKLTSTKYDKSLLTQLKEIFSDEELKEYGYNPPYTETRIIPEAWDMRKVKGLTKFGNHIQVIIEASVIPSEITDVVFKGK